MISNQTETQSFKNWIFSVGNILQNKLFDKVRLAEHYAYCMTKAFYQIYFIFFLEILHKRYDIYQEQKYSKILGIYLSSNQLQQNTMHTHFSKFTPYIMS